MPYLKRKRKEPVRKINQQDRQKIYQSKRWKELRLAKLREQPLCEICLLIDKITPSCDIHHIDSYMNYEGLKRINKAYDFNNLLSVCKEHHSYLHKKGTTHSIDLEQIKNELLKVNDSELQKSAKNSLLDSRKMQLQ